MQMGVGAANEPNHVKKKKEEKRKTKEARIIHRTRLLTDGSIKKGRQTTQETWKVNTSGPICLVQVHIRVSNHATKKTPSRPHPVLNPSQSFLLLLFESCLPSLSRVYVICDACPAFPVALSSIKRRGITYPCLRTCMYISIHIHTLVVETAQCHRTKEKTKERRIQV
ncbi:hypothetical protein M431DRAFT_385590 [Trichoderma harzianum CBS 226.95]|uniref:Uncharacterized protein n=1 Tax=Trichoderma harzianum CBS 226.95 TaxID=983964 RepID=A0A2T4AI21_TRIHA|nr:hypothetical protein M431DRAFT_385590 [Trichoderma harzianum CBS 226.95]PTB56734.1 hypothetical protein M431DRAFT_385590 [Trichoderma harzianum CBS 226.95]